MRDPYLVSMGKKLKARRIELSLSQYELGAISGINRTYISGMEGGRRNATILVLMRLAQALDISIASILPDRDELEALGSKGID